MNDWKAKEAAEASAVAALVASNPHLVPAAGCKGGSRIAATKNIRIELKRAFPGVKFSIKSSSFSGGDDIRVGWTDGPTSGQVEEIISRYAAGTFNGMDDSYTYSRDYWPKAFGNAKYIIGNRHMSDAAIAAAIRLVRAQWGADQVGEDATVDAYRRGALMSKPSPYLGDLQALIGHALYRQCYALTQPYMAIGVEEEAEA